VTNINCQNECLYKKNGKCVLNTTVQFSSCFDKKTDCAYFSPTPIKKINTPTTKEY